MGEASPQAMVKTLGKALALLDKVGQCEHPPTIGELAVIAGMSRPTTHRLVQTLVAAGFLQQNPRDARLSIGLSVLPLASRLLDTHRLRTDALPHLQALAQKLNTRVNMGVLHQGRIMILAGADKPHLPTIYSRFGRTVPVHCCGLGKAILAWLPQAQVQAILAERPMVARTPNTLTSVPALLAELDATRDRGWSTEFRENTATSCCIAVPVFDGAERPAAAISIAGRSLEALEAEVPAALETAELISHMLQ
ncbi:IclR family transcriptional regulator [Ramlibacter sp. AW1]|uniref:IclR family transcriptional regulator n=1 Tax=Ramlibacter aurantiacus TaxID=2801330 RepID=A0A936ZRQ7_9BURK|nr:IclR family transcriptional regulator [Ramlibacter aurantiacus]MBL0419850.1 IclR family transcriptional regulator [Ramlibacter aurantiacus]